VVKEPLLSQYLTVL